MIALLLSMVLIVSMSMAVYAGTSTGHGDIELGTYYSSLSVTTEYTWASISYETESPSDQLYTRLNGTADIGYDYDELIGYGYGSCSARLNGTYDSASCAYYVGSSYAGYLRTNR